MSSGNGQGRQPFDVGYGKPPRATRFRKGQSGNPNGRPKKQKKALLEVTYDSQSDAILRRELDRLINVTDRDGTRQLTMQEAIRLAQIKSALGGSPIAQRHLLDAAGALELREAAKAAYAEERRKERFENVVEWRKIRQEKWAAAEKEGREPIEPWPHPDDMMLDYRTHSYWIRGPLKEDDCARFEYYLALRDQARIRAELELRRPRHMGEQRAEIEFLLVEFYDRLLPQRWQLGALGKRLDMALAIAPAASIRRILRQIEVDVRYWHKQAYPFGERVKIDLDVAKILRPHVKALGYRSIKEYERHLERQSGNPPNPLVEAVKKRIEGPDT